VTCKVPDIHCVTRYAPSLQPTLPDFVAQNLDEKTQCGCITQVVQVLPSKGGRRSDGL
jgi:hypothetical protein